MKTFTFMFLILPFLTFQIENNHVDKFIAYFNPENAIEYYKAGINFTESSSGNIISVNPIQLGKYLSVNSKNLVDASNDIKVKFQITSNNDKITLTKKDFEISIGTYSDGTLKGLGNSYQGSTDSFTCEYNKEGVTDKLTEEISFIIQYNGYPVTDVPYANLTLIDTNDEAGELPNFIRLTKKTDFQYDVDIDIMPLYDNLNSGNLNKFLHDKSGSINLKFYYQRKKYDNNAPEDGNYEVEIGTYADGNKQKFTISSNDNEKKHDYEESFYYWYTGESDNITLYNDKVSIIVKYNYPNKQDLTLQTRENGPAKPFLNVNGETYENIDTFDYSAEYEKAGMKFDANTNTITLDRLKLLEYIAEDKNNLTYLIASDGTYKYIAYGLQLTGYSNDFHTKYTHITTTPKIDFAELKNHVDDDNVYKERQIVYFFVAKVSFDGSNKALSIPDFRKKENYLLRYIWQGSSATNANEKIYATSETKVNILLKEDYENFVPDIRENGPATGLSDTPISAGFEYSKAYEKAGIQFSNNEIIVNHTKLEAYANNADTKQDFLRLCNEYPSGLLYNPKRYNVYIGLQFKPGDEYTEFMKGGEAKGVFYADSFKSLETTPDGNQFYNKKVTRYIKVATFVNDGTNIIINELPDTEYTYNYIWKSTTKKTNGYKNGYKLGVATIKVKTNKNLETDPSKVQTEGVSLNANNLQVNLNSILNKGSFENNFLKSIDQHLYLPIPFKGMNSLLTASQNEEELSIPGATEMPSLLITHTYPFASSNPEHGIHSGTVSRLVCVAKVEPYKDGLGNPQNRLQPCENSVYPAEQRLLASHLNYKVGRWTYNLPQITVSYDKLCTSGQNDCEQCSENELTCAKCMDGFVYNILTGTCKKDNGFDITNLEYNEATCQIDENNQMKFDVDFSKPNSIFEIKCDKDTKDFDFSQIAGNSAITAPGKTVTIFEGAKTITVGTLPGRKPTTIDISKFKDGIVPNLNLQTEDSGEIPAVIKIAAATDAIQINSDENKVNGNLALIVPDNVKKVGFKAIQLFAAGLQAIHNSDSPLIKMLEEEMIPLEFSNLEVNNLTSLYGNANIKEALTIQPEGILFLRNDCETTVENIIYNLEGAEEMPKLITKIPEKAAPKKITINAEQLSNEGTTTIPLVLGTYHFDICTTWKKNSEIKKEGKHDYKVKCVDATPYLNTESAKAFLKKLEEEGKDKIPPNTYVLAVTNDKKLKDALDKDKKKLSAGAIAGIVIACVVVVAAIIGLLVYFLVIKKKKDATSSTQGDSSIAI